MNMEYQKPVAIGDLVDHFKWFQWTKELSLPRTETDAYDFGVDYLLM